MTTHQPPRKRPPATHKKPWWLWAGIAGIVALALVIAVWGASGSDNKAVVGETRPVTVVGTPLPGAPQSGADTAIGLTPPTLHGSSFDGSPIDITPGGGRAKMVVFLAHWCPHCNNEIPVILRWAATGGVPDNLDIVAVSTSANAQRDHYPPSKWIVAMKWTWPVLADSATADAAQAYGVTSFPTFTIVGSDGVVKLRSSGELAETELDGLVAKALTG
jgi:thiol-disulfide isomerase/thioredoxin